MDRTQEYSWNSEEPHEEAIPVARSPGVGGCIFRLRPWEGPGALGRAWAAVTTELRDQRQQGTEAEMLADHWPAEQLQMNEDFGTKRGKGSRQPLVKHPVRGQVRIRHWPKTHGISSASGCDFFALQASDSCVCVEGSWGLGAHGVELHGSKESLPLWGGGCVVHRGVLEAWV